MHLIKFRHSEKENYDVRWQTTLYFYHSFIHNLFGIGNAGYNKNLSTKMLEFAYVENEVYKKKVIE